MVNQWYQSIGKRILDIIVSLVALVILLPVMLTISILIYYKLGKPIIFRQERPGLNAKIFTLYKFRTMRDTRNKNGNLLSDAERLVPLGRFLRNTSLDELPELINVLRGDMSLVGPRPLLVEYLSRYTPRQSQRHNVKPGITGWAQIHGRQNIKFSQRIEYDLWYIEHLSLWLDLKILIQTIGLAIRGSGVKNGQNVQEVDDLGLSQSAKG